MCQCTNKCMKTSVRSLSLYRRRCFCRLIADAPLEAQKLSKSITFRSTPRHCCVVLTNVARLPAAVFGHSRRLHICGPPSLQILPSVHLPRQLLARHRRVVRRRRLELHSLGSVRPQSHRAPTSPAHVSPRVAGITDAATAWPPCSMRVRRWMLTPARFNHPGIVPKLRFESHSFYTDFLFCRECGGTYFLPARAAVQ